MQIHLKLALTKKVEFFFEKLFEVRILLNEGNESNCDLKV